MHSENALDLPEIRSLVGSFLSRHDILHCSLVCKSWQSTFAPLLWRETTILSSFSLNWTLVAPPPPRSMIHSHAHLIRSLAYVGGPISMEEISLGDNCYQLEHLRLTATVSRPSPSVNRGAPDPQTLSTAWSWLEHEENEDSSGDDSDNGGWIGSENMAIAAKGNEYDGDMAWRQLAEMVTRNQSTLRSLYIVLTSPPPAVTPTREFWDVVVKCFPSQSSFSLSARLTDLHLSGREIKLEDLMFVWGAGMPFLKTVQLSRFLVEYEPWTQFVSSKDMISGMSTNFTVASGLRHLELQEIRGMDPETQYAVFIARSPRLKTLEWSIHRSQAGATLDFGPAIPYHLQPQRQWVELESIVITSERETKAFPDSLMATVLDQTSSGVLKKLVLKAIDVGELTLRSLRNHYEHLQTLNLGQCSAVTSREVQQILTSCAKMEYFVANAIHVRDIQNRDPWVCLKLRSWSVFIDFSQPQSHAGLEGAYVHQAEPAIAQTQDSSFMDIQHRAVFDQLARLTCLETLDLSRKYPSSRRGPPVETLHWRLQSGLGRLSSLSELSSIQLLSQHTMNMSNSAVHWMIEHLPKLERVQGRLGMRKSDHRDLGRILKRHGIECSPEN